MRITRQQTGHEPPHAAVPSVRSPFICIQGQESPHVRSQKLLETSRIGRWQVCLRCSYYWSKATSTVPRQTCPTRHYQGACATPDLDFFAGRDCRPNYNHDAAIGVNCKWLPRAGLSAHWMRGSADSLRLPLLRQQRRRWPPAACQRSACWPSSARVQLCAKAADQCAKYAAPGHFASVRGAEHAALGLRI